MRSPKLRQPDLANPAARGRLRRRFRPDESRRHHARDLLEAEAPHLFLFPDARPLPAGLPAPALPIQWTDTTLNRPPDRWGRVTGLEIPADVKLDEFSSEKLGRNREGTDWAALLKVSVADRLISPGSEWNRHHHGYDPSAAGELMGGNFHWG